MEMADAISLAASIISFAEEKMRMCELSAKEREILDEINEFNKRSCVEPGKSLWAVCKGYLDGLFGKDLLSKTDSEIREALGKANAAVGMAAPVQDEPPKSGRLF